MVRVICISPPKRFTSSNGSLKTTLTRMLSLIAAIKNTHPLPIFMICSILELLRLIKAWVTLPLTHIFHKIENNLAILRGIFLILSRNVYHYHLFRTELWQRNMILSTAKNRQTAKVLLCSNLHASQWDQQSSPLLVLQSSIYSSTLSITYLPHFPVF